MRPITENRPDLFLLKVPVFVLLLIAAISLVRLIEVRFYYQQGKHEQIVGNLTNALTIFEKTENHLPKRLGAWFVRQDRFRISSAAGQTQYQAALENFRKTRDYAIFHETVETAHASLVNARKIDPKSYINTYWLARAEHSLEQTHRLLYPHLENPYNAFDLYQSAMALRPSSHTVRHWFVKYLVFRRMPERIPAVVENILEIYPPAYRALTKEPFFNNQLLAAARQGLENALKQNTLPAFALRNLIDAALALDDLEGAIRYSRTLISITPRGGLPDALIRLGNLYITSGDHEKARQVFLQALETVRPSVAGPVLNRIYQIYRGAGLLDAFLGFSTSAEEQNLESQALDMAVARCWLEKKQPQLARARLMKLNSRKPHAPAYFMLADIARKEENWRQMELDSYQALQLDRDNKTYLRGLVTALRKQGKKDHALEFEQILKRK
jgi:hypothetical protein